MVKRKLHGSTEITLVTVPRLRRLIRYLLRQNCGYAYSNRAIRAIFCLRRFEYIGQRLKTHRSILSRKKKEKERINMDKDTRVSYYEYEPVNYFSSKKLHPVLRRFSTFLWSLVFHTRRIVSIEKFLAHQSTSYPSNNSFTETSDDSFERRATLHLCNVDHADSTTTTF